MTGTLDEAAVHHAAGRFEAAQQGYRQVLETDPANADALHLLGVLCWQCGRAEAGAGLIGRAIALRPDVPFYHLNLGNALQTLGKLEDAARCYREAARLHPGFAEARNNLGSALSRLGRLEEAETAFRAALALRPGDALALNNLAAVLLRRGRYTEGEQAARAALASNAGSAEAHNQLAIALLEQGKKEEAAAECREALRLRPDYAHAHNNLGAALERLGRAAEALACYEAAAQLQPGYLDAWNNRAGALLKLERPAEAIACCRRVLELSPEDADAWNNFGNLMQCRGRAGAAVACYRRALALRPQFATAHANLVFCLNYDVEQTPATLFTAHREWAAAHARGIRSTVDHGNQPDPERPLRIGYLSPDFRDHPVAFFVEPVLERHRAEAFQVTCYSNVAQPDAVTDRFRGLAPRWRDVHGLPDARVAEMVREDGIDILVDLAGFTTGGRLLVLARKPAPIQAAWLGYPNTTGLEAVDYRITDERADPPGVSDTLHTEELLRLEHGFLCYKPPDHAPDPASPGGSAPVFGCFNNLAKVSPPVVEAFAAILRAAPGSRLILKSKPLADGETRERVAGEFRARGVSAAQLELAPPVRDHAGHLAVYREIDLGLDTFPYNGTTTTCEALWMGVPVLALAGDRHAGRVGASLLAQVGLDELVAPSIDAYVAAAVALARHRDRLRALGEDLRGRMRHSPLTNAADFTRRLEDAYRRMWRRWCGRCR